MTSPWVVWLMTTIGGACFYVFLVRRQHEDEEAWSAALVPASEAQGPVAARGPAPAPPPVDRPLAASAAATTAPSAVRREPQVFATPAAKGAERVRIGYRRVRLSSKPDAVRSVELGRLEQGDEVEILESYEGFLRVQTAGGITGWIQRHTVVGDQ